MKLNSVFYVNNIISFPLTINEGGEFKTKFFLWRKLGDPINEQSHISEKYHGKFSTKKKKKSMTKY